MKISRSYSEKRTYRTTSDEFISREHSVSRSIELPLWMTLSDVRVYLEETRIDYSLKAEVLRLFVLEGSITQDEMRKRLAPLEAMMKELEAKAPPQPTEEEMKVRLKEIQDSLKGKDG